MAARALGLGKPEGQGMKYAALCAKTAVYPPLIMITGAKKYHISSFDYDNWYHGAKKYHISAGRYMIFFGMPLIMITGAKKYHLAIFNCGQTGGMSAKSVLSSGMLGAKVKICFI